MPYRDIHHGDPGERQAAYSGRNEIGFDGEARRRFTAGVDFEILGKLSQIETIATRGSIQDLARLNRKYGKGRWRKLKGIATVRLTDGSIHKAEVHWYEAHGIGKREFKIKFPLLD